jgi:hypothetical protein
MRQASALWEVFVLRFEEALERYRKRRLTADERSRPSGKGQAARHSPPEARAPPAPRHAAVPGRLAHRWIAGLGQDLDLLVTLDEATRAI